MNRSTDVKLVSYKGVNILCGVIVFYITTTIPAGVLLTYIMYIPMTSLFEKLHFVFEHSITLTLCQAIFHPILYGFGQTAFKREMVKQWHVMFKDSPVNVTPKPGNVARDLVTVMSV
jgi:hypothetical protein